MAPPLRPQTKTPATSGRTNVPARTVTTPVPRLPKPARPSLTAAQEATLHVKQLLAPQYTQAATAAAAQNAAISNFTKAMIAQLQSVPGQVQGDYNNAYNAQAGMVNAAANSLRNANPNQQDQELLKAINAPESQQQALASQNANTFNGGAAVGQYVNGVLPLGALQSQGLAATTLARLQPGFATLRGQQALAGALYQQQQDRQKIASQAPALEQNWLNSFQSNKAKQQQLAYEAQALGLKTQNQQFNQKLAVTKLQTQQQQFLSRQQQQIALYNSRQTTEQAKLALPNGALSSKYGYLVDSHGAPIGGKITPLPGYRIFNGQIVKKGTKAKTSKLTAYQTQKFKGQAATIASNSRDGFDGKDSAGNPKHFPPLTRAQAWAEMMKHGIPETVALAALNKVYIDPNPATNPNAAGPPAP